MKLLNILLFLIFFSQSFSYHHIQTLRKDYHGFFKKPINYSIYSKDIVLNTNNKRVHGLQKYKYFFRSLQFLSNILIRDSDIQILYTIETEKTIEIVWKVHILTKILQFVCFNGHSIYEKNNVGIITNHNITYNLSLHPTVESTFEKVIVFENPCSVCCSNRDCNSKFKCDDTFHYYPHPWKMRPVHVRSSDDF